MANKRKQRRGRKKSVLHCSDCTTPSVDMQITVNVMHIFPRYNTNIKNSGGYAIVYKAIDLKTSQFVAIKRVKTYNLKSHHVGNNPCIELQILHQFRSHEHFPTIREALLDKASGSYSIVMNYFEHQPFSQYNQKLNEMQIIKYIHVLLTCIKALSDKGFIHRDIKPQNFLFNPKQNKYMLIDFGLCQLESSLKAEHQKELKLINQLRSKRYATRSNKMHAGTLQDRAVRDGTPQWRAPEVVLHSTNQDSRIDIFNAGLILALLMLRSNVLFNPTSDYQALCQFIAVYGLHAMTEAADVLDRNIEIRGLHKSHKINFNNGKDSLFSGSYVTGYEVSAQGGQSGLAHWIQRRLEYLKKKDEDEKENRENINMNGSNKWSEDLYDLLDGLTACNMHNRLAPKTALQHRIFSRFD